MADWDNEFLSKKQVYCRLREISEDYGHHSVDKQSAALRCRDAIMEMPSADVAPVVHGEWMGAESDDEQFFLCSVCNDKEYWESNYCPECGAKMDLEDKKMAEYFVCECCGQRFYNKHEYNTHKNFYEGRHWYGPKAERDILRDMFMYGYDLRNKSTIEKRLQCFTSWENIDDGRKSRIKNKANSLLVRMDKAEKYAEKIVSRSTPM